MAPGKGVAAARSDEHPAYPRALARLRDRHLTHEVTASGAARTARNPIFPVTRQDETPARQLGLADDRLTLPELLRERLLRSRIELRSVLRRSDERRVLTRRPPHAPPHERIDAM